MFLIEWVKKIIFKKEIISNQSNNSIYKKENEEIEEIHSVWDYLSLLDNSQASHLSAVLSFEEWISMDEILRRIRDIFHMDYKNIRSLYPYIKTLVDVGIVETSNVGGKKRWRKKDILIKLQGKKEENKIGAVIVTKSKE